MAALRTERMNHLAGIRREMVHAARRVAGRAHRGRALKCIFVHSPFVHRFVAARVCVCFRAGAAARRQDVLAVEVGEARPRSQRRQAAVAVHAELKLAKHHFFELLPQVLCGRLHEGLLSAVFSGLAIAHEVAPLDNQAQDRSLLRPEAGHALFLQVMYWPAHPKERTVVKKRKVEQKRAWSWRGGLSRARFVAELHIGKRDGWMRVSLKW